MEADSMDPSGLWGIYDVAGFTPTLRLLSWTPEI